MLLFFGGASGANEKMENEIHPNESGVFRWCREEEICCRQQGVASPHEQNLFTKANLAVLLARTSENTKPPSISSLDKQKTPHQKGCFCLAQRRGFEPPVRFRRTHDFQGFKPPGHKSEPQAEPPFKPRYK